jgi:serine/threonine-protein kinase
VAAIDTPPEAEAPRFDTKYQILAELGHGGMGVVYKARQTARQTRLNQLVPLKMVLAGGRASGTQLARFTAEARAVAKLDHPNIVRVIDIGDHDGLPFFATEFVEGGAW